MSWQPDRNISLAPLTTWRIGGPAEWFSAPQTEADLDAALQWAAEHGQPLTIIGRGSNLLISDDGVRGLVLCLRHFAKDEHRVLRDRSGTRLEVSAGMSLPRLAKLAAQLEYTGYEFYIGIPGTVGGALVMNAGFGPGDERQTANRCVELKSVIPGEAPCWQAYAGFAPDYRFSRLQDSPRIVTAARFELRDKATREAIRAATAGHLAMRRMKQPLTRPTAGSVFKATGDGVPAAVLIDRCGLKGTRIGGAVVSPKHANWIENMGGASAADIRALIERVRETVESREGVRLEAEVRFLR